MRAPPTTIAVYTVVALAVVLLGVRELRRPAPTAGRAPTVSTAPTVALDEPGSGGRGATVHVAGAVRRPGVYRLRAGARVEDAVRSAGGPTARADVDAINLAAPVEDGRQIVVPQRAPGAGPGSTATPPAGAAGAAARAEPIDLNTATLEQLDTLDGIGPGLAQRILDYREEHGGFGAVDELAQVPGIGDKRLAALRERVRT